MANRRKFSAEQKVAILRQHLLEKVPVSQVCEQHGIQPTQFYQWQKVFFEGGALAFGSRSDGKDGKVKKLEQENARLKLQRHKNFFLMTRSPLNIPLYCAVMTPETVFVTQPFVNPHG